MEAGPAEEGHPDLQPGPEQGLQKEGRFRGGQLRSHSAAPKQQ